MVRRIRFSLAGFLVGAILTGSAVGIFVRWYRAQPDHYVQDVVGVDGYKVNASWLVDHAGRDKLIWLLVIPYGETAFSGADKGVTRPNYDESRNPPFGIGLYAKALYETGKKVPGSGDGRVWLYLTSKQKLVEIDTSRFPDTDLSLKAFDHLGETELWKQVLKPAADAESDNAGPYFRLLRLKRQAEAAKRAPPKGNGS